MAALAGGHGSMADFKIESSLGKGSYGSVFKATRKSDGIAYVCPAAHV
jgi:hypothetical protein